MITLESDYETPISEARKIIYGSQDIKVDAEQIQRLLEGASETDRTLVLAELYHHTGLVDRANRQLRARKKALDPSTQGEEIKAINQAMKIVQCKRVVGFEWNVYWNERENAINEKEHEGNAI